jgi:phosphate transport system protein
MENPHIVKKFDKNLQKIKSVILEMGVLVIRQLEDATDVLFAHDQKEVARIEELDLTINGYHKDIHSRAEILIARRQPVAFDLRATLAPIEVARELERIGDYAKTIAGFANVFAKTAPNAEHIVQINQMSAAARVMLDEVLRAYMAGDIDLAAQVRAQDLQIDTLNETIRKNATEMAGNSVDDAKACIAIILVAQKLERVGDHIANISRYINQVYTGDDLKRFK